MQRPHLFATDAVGEAGLRVANQVLEQRNDAREPSARRQRSHSFEYAVTVVRCR
jgi:hypothetical protein